MSEDHITTIATRPNGRTRAGRTSSAKPALSKKDRLEALLSRPKGATIVQLEQSLGWQAHTVRAAISRLRKGGAEVSLDRSGKTPAYRLATGA